MRKIKRLPQEIVNQIAAGEVIEKPSSVIKELIDNAIDAGATKIEVDVIEGGKKKIKVTDNGSGIPKGQLASAFEAHTTSKLTSIEDLNNLLTMGFRGEALSTIVSVSKVKALTRTKEEEVGRLIEFEGIEPLPVRASPARVGTSIEVTDLFSNIPARLKYLRTNETEYRNILKILIPYFLYYPNIHFILNKDGRSVYNLPSTKDNFGLDQTRISQTVKSDFTEEMLEIFYEGNGISISGFVAKPSYHRSRVNVAYTFLNGRPIQDNGVFKSIMQGFGSYIPHGDKIPFIVSLQVNQTMVDINVHPRKEEVRFINPFRIYNAVEQAVDTALEKNITFKDTFMNDKDDAYSRLRGTKDTITRTHHASSSYGHGKNDSDEKQYSFRQPSKNRVSSSLLFSESLLSSDSPSPVGEEDNIDVNVNEDPINSFQLFKKYLVLEFEDQAWFIDQHAAAERIAFEALQCSKISDVQKFLLPKEIKIDRITKSFIEEQEDLLNDLGFSLEIVDDICMINSAPTIFEQSDLQAMFDQILTDDLDNYTSKTSIERIKDDIYATMACHNSIRSHQSIEKEEAVSIYQRLRECKNPYSCPHGRPIIWKLSLRELDSKFDRTY